MLYNTIVTDRRLVSTLTELLPFGPTSPTAEASHYTSHVGVIFVDPRISVIMIFASGLLLMWSVFKNRSALSSPAHTF